MKRKIAAILAADVVEYSRLVAEDEEETLRPARVRGGGIGAIGAIRTTSPV